MTIPTDRTTPANTPVFLKYESRAEYTTGLAVFEEMGFLGTINGLLDATIVVTDPTTAGCTITVTSTATGKGVTGLVEADFVIKDESGVTQDPESVTPSDSTPGEYAVLDTYAEEDHTADLLAPASMTTDGWESTGEAEFTVSS